MEALRRLTPEDCQRLQAQYLQAIAPYMERLVTLGSLAIVGYCVGLQRWIANFARVLLCPRCGISALNFNRSTVFLIFFCGWAKNN